MTHTSKDRIELVQKCLHAYGEAVRGDWSDIDGREVQYTLSQLAEVLDETAILPTFEEWLGSNGIVKNSFGRYEWEVLYVAVI